MPVDHSKHGFLRDIGTDWVAIAANGEPVARAIDEDGVRRAAPNAIDYITGKKATKHDRIDVTDMRHLGPPTTDPVVAATQHQPEHTFEETLLHVEKTHDPQASREENVQKAQAAEEARKDSLEGQTREAAEQRKAEAADPQAAKAEVAAKDALDHDGDGRKGGSPKGDEATASKKRQRKPAA